MSFKSWHNDKCRLYLSNRFSTGLTYSSKISGMSSKKPSAAELEILQVVWANQPCTVKVIHEHVSQIREIGYTTTLKQIQRMLDKGLLTRQPGKGKSYLYSAAESAQTTQGQLFDRLVENAFGNSVTELMMHALGKSKASPDEIEQIKKIIADLDQKKD